MTFVPGKIVKCPKCGANFDLTLQNYIPETDSARCPQGHVFSIPREEVTPIYRGKKEVSIRLTAEKVEAVVTEKEIPTFTPAFLSKVKEAWETRKTQSFWDWIIEPASYPERGVYVRLRDVKKPHEFFPAEIVEKMEYDEEEKVYRVMEEWREIKKWKLWFTSPMGFEHFVQVDAFDLDEAKKKAEKEVPKGSTYRGEVG